MLEAGVAKVQIDPAIGMRLAGFAARKDVCRGVHDHLYARALVLANSADTVAIVAVDVLALPAEFVGRVREAIARKTPLAPSAITIACTHTHAAPVTIRTFFNPDEEVESGYMESLAAAIQESVATAWNGRFRATVGVGSTTVHGLGVNRRSADGRPVDDEVGIVRIADEHGEVRAVLMNYGCHPTVLGPDNLLASADFPAAAIERIETARGGVAMFVNGAEGDVSVGHSSELSAIGVIAQGRTFERAAALGSRLGDSVLAALDTMDVDAAPTLKAVVATVELPLKRFPSPAQAARDLATARARLGSFEPSADEYRQAQSGVLYASITNFYAAETAALDGTLRIELQGIRIGDAMLVAVPAEVFVEVGLGIKRGTPRRVFVIGVANGYIGYLPDRSAYAVGGYEVVSAKVDETAGDRIIDSVMEIERRLFG